MMPLNGLNKIQMLTLKNSNQNKKNLKESSIQSSPKFINQCQEVKVECQEECLEACLEVSLAVSQEVNQEVNQAQENQEKDQQLTMLIESAKKGEAFEKFCNIFDNNLCYIVY
jgi:hypothetical protein